jgi:hypothetical protein
MISIVIPSPLSSFSLTARRLTQMLLVLNILIDDKEGAFGGAFAR